MIPKITTDELKKIRQRLCPHNLIQQTDNILDWECSDCGKLFFFLDVMDRYKLRKKGTKFQKEKSRGDI